MQTKKGFTLVELISVIAILSLILILTIPTITNISSRGDESLKDSKIRTIEAMGTKYGNSSINLFQNCTGTLTNIELKNKCTVGVQELVTSGYIKADDNENNFLDPETREPFKGNVLMCYNPASLTISASYIEDESQYKCDVIDVESGASLNLSSISGIGYVGGNPIDISIIQSGIQRGGFSCESDENLVKCDVSDSTKMKLEITSEPFEEGFKETKVTLIGKTTKDTELKQTYTLVIYPTFLDIDKPDDDDVCMPMDTSKQFGLVTSVHTGSIVAKSDEEDILEADINQTVLTVTSKNKPGLATITVKENNGNLTRDLERYVYNLAPTDEIPDDLLVGNSKLIKIDYAGNEEITVTSDTPDILKVSLPDEENRTSITLHEGVDEEFIINVVGIGEGHITIEGKPCGRIEKTITSSNLYIKNTEAEVYIGGKSFLTEIVSGFGGAYECESADEDIAACKVIGSTIEIIPKTMAGITTITVKGELGGEDEITVRAIKPLLEVLDKSENKISHVCSSVDETINDRRALIKSENTGTLTIGQSDTKLALISYSRGEILASKNFLAGSYVTDGYREGYNTGVVNVSINESNGNTTVPLDYYIYKIEAPRDSYEVISGKKTIIDIPNYASGPLNIYVNDESIAHITIENPTDYSYELNHKNESRLLVDAHKTGETSVTIRGEKCGNITFKLIVKGNTLSMPIEKGTYTDFIGEEDQNSVSCTTMEDNRTCEVTFPEFKVKNGFVPLGYGMVKDGLEVTYKPGDTITLDESIDGTKIYANAIVKDDPVCEFRKPLLNIKAGEINTLTLVCKDPSISTSDLTKEDFIISNPEAAELLSVGERVELVDEYGREGYSYKLEIEGKKFGAEFDLTLKEGSFIDQFEKGIKETKFTSILAGSYNSYKHWYIGKENPQDAIAVLYLNKDLPDEITTRNDDYYTLILYGTGETRDFNTEEGEDSPPWITAGYQEYITDAVVEEGITKIGKANFYALYNMEHLTLSEGITDIGESAFSFAVALKSIHLPSTVQNIGDKAFEMCITLEDLRLNSGLLTIGIAAFKNHYLEEVFIPNTVTFIDNYAFFSDYSGEIEDDKAVGLRLKKIVFEENSQLQSISIGAFKNCCVESLNIPSSVTSIGSQAFSQYDYYSDNLKTLTFENDSHLETISAEAFKYNCIENLVLPDSLKIIANFAFDGILDETVSIGSNVMELGPNFALGNNVVSYVVDPDNESFISIDGIIYTKDMRTLIKCPPNYHAAHDVLDIPDGIEQIGKYAFAGWSKYEKTRQTFAINFPSSITEMNLNDNFLGGVFSAYNFEDNEYYSSKNGVLFNADKTIAYRLPTHYSEEKYTVPSGVKELSDSFAFLNVSVKEIVIPSSVTKLSGLSLATDPNDALSTIYLKVDDTADIFEDALTNFYYTYGEDVVYSKDIIVKTEFLKERILSLYEPIQDELNVIVREEEEPSAIDQIVASSKGVLSTTFDDPASIDEAGVYELADEGGTSYYFRGPVENNYVRFGKWADGTANAGKDMYWRIIRVNGDGSLRMIYAGTKAHVNDDQGEDTFIGASAFNTNFDDAKYVGYMYGPAGTTASTSIEQAQTNVESSTIKSELESWYDTNLKDYDAYISKDAVFCYDRSVDKGASGWIDDTGLGYGTNTTAYGAMNRFVDESSGSWVGKTNITPKFVCSQENDKFTSKESTATIGNKKLEYPVGLISADEVVAAGSGKCDTSSTYYLKRSGRYWTGSPVSSSDGGFITVFGVYSEGEFASTIVDSYNSLAPVINLTPEYAMTLTGTGKVDDPYHA